MQTNYAEPAVKIQKLFEKEEHCIELGSVSELTLGYLWEVPEGMGRFYNPGY